MKKKRLLKSTCFMMGLIGATVGALCGLLVAFGLGQALLFRSISLVMQGAMVLFLALAEQGTPQKTKRAKLLALFFLVVLAYPDLPLLSPVAELLVLPLATLLYGRRKEDGLLWVLLLLAELLFASCKTLALFGNLQAYALLLTGGGLFLVSIFRFLFLCRLYRRSRAEENPL